ncbi:WecB/TagA/CpsF family glycosyltransferase [Bosea vaviloviae]|uniref:WecB/TagA/CpsF family glycosyltransferase n=1 Tax=Bosea vaviloviae TaxID=1526658 RepID=UPI000A6A75FF|nr:WecB/TagA/CpsF family glycosyltransferase [Bosea vaviloviae]
MSRRSSPDFESLAAQKPGTGVWPAKATHLPKVPRTSQAPGLPELLAQAQGGGTRVFFFGSAPGIVYALRDKVASDFPRLVIAGICDADFSGAVSSAIVDFIAATTPGMIVVDMAEREFSAFVRSNGHRFPDASLVHLDGAFCAYLLPQGRRAVLSRRSLRHGVPLIARSLSAARFCGIVLAQLLQGGMSRVRVARSGAAMRRDG